MLLDRPTALAKASETEEKLHEIRAFWKHEALPLRKVILELGTQSYPITQTDRDLLFIQYRSARA